MSLVVLRSWSDGPPKVRGIAPSDTDEFVYVPDHRGQFVQQQVGGPKSSSSAATASSPPTKSTDSNASEKTHGMCRTNPEHNNRDETPSRRRIVSIGEEIITAERKKTENSNYQSNNNEDEDNNSSTTAISDSSCGKSQKHNRYGSTPNISVLDVHTTNHRALNSNFHRWSHQEGRTPVLVPRPSDRILLRSSSTSPEQELLDSPPPASPLSGRYRHLGPELAACIPKRQLKFGTNWLRDDPSNIGIKWSHRRSLSNSTPSLSHSQDFYSSEEEKMSSYSSQSSSKTPSPQPPTPSSSYRRRHFHFGTKEDKAQEDITIHRIVETPGLESLSLSSPTATTETLYEDPIDESSPENSSSAFSSFNLKRTQIDGRYSSSSQNSRGHRRPRQRQLLSSPSTPPPPPPDQHDYYRNLHQAISSSLPVKTTLTEEEEEQPSNPAAHYLRALKSANQKSSNSTNFKGSHLRPLNLTPTDPKVSSEDDEEASQSQLGGGKTSKTDVILVHVIRKKLKVKSSGYDNHSQSNSVSGSSDSGSDTTDGNSTPVKGKSSQCHSAPTNGPLNASSFVKKNNQKNHQLNSIPIRKLSAASTPISLASTSLISAVLTATTSAPAERSYGNASPLSTLTSSEQIEQKVELIQDNLTPLKSNNNNDGCDIITSQDPAFSIGKDPALSVQDQDYERGKPEDSIPQNLSSDTKNKSSSALNTNSVPIYNSTAQVAEVEEKSESQKKAERGEGTEEVVKEGDAEDEKQDQTPVGIAPGCSAQFTSSTCSSLLVVGNNKDTTTATNSSKPEALVPSDTKGNHPNSSCLDSKGEVHTGAGTLELPSCSSGEPKSHSNHCSGNYEGQPGELCECPEKTTELGPSDCCSDQKIDSDQSVKDNAIRADGENSVHDTHDTNSTNIGSIPALSIVEQVLTEELEQKIQETPHQSSGTSCAAEEEAEERMERGKNNHQGPSPIASVKIPVQAINKYVRSDSSDEFETEVNIWRNSAVRESFRGFCQELLESSSDASSQDGLNNEGRSSLGSSHEKIIIHVPQSQLGNKIPCQAINEGVIEFEDDEDVDEEDRCSSSGLSLNDRPETPSQRNNSIEYISVLDNVQVNGAVHRSQSDVEYRGVNGNEDEDKHKPKPTKWIISLDLGSRSSGFSYWYHGDPNVVHIGSWSGDNCFHKIPSWILFDNNSKNLSESQKQSLIVNAASIKVGQEALDSYMERRGQSSCGTFVSQWREFLQMDSEAARLLTFPYTLDSVDDEMDFVQLVTALVNFFGRAALGQIRSKFSNAFHKDEHLEWLITIPTSWNTHSRQCIREAAYKSGVVKVTDGVNLIEDPMAAALFASMCGQYDSFLAVDVGGAFMHYSGFIRNNYGSMTQALEARSLSFPTPESAFETYLTQVVSREFMLYYKAKYRPGWIELMRNFEKAKCKFDGSLTVHSSAFIYLPYSFVHEFYGYTGMQLSECLEEQNSGILWNDNGALSISEDEMRLLLKPTVDSILQQIEPILNKHEFKNIVLTGGFAKSKFVKECLTSKFPAMNLILPKEFPNGVLQGATLSLMPNIQPKLVIKSPFSIGVGVMTPFDEEIHPAEKKIVKDGKTWCADAWDTLIKYDQEMEINSVINKRSYVGAQPGQSCLVLPLFKSSSSSVPKLVTDKSVVKCCELRFESTKTWQEIDLILSCRASELIVMAVDRDSVVHRVVIDFI